MDALRDDAQCLFISGLGVDPEPGNDPVIVPGIGYDGMRTDERPRKIAGDILAAIEAKWPSGCDVLHVHNPILKKNRDFLKILRCLADRGQRLFLQVHDTAEDLRPQSYYSDEEYPEDCHYGVINSRDYALFREAGLTEEGLHRIFNVVQPLPAPDVCCAVQEPGGESGRALLLYAVRAIRRKNLGEALFLSCFLPQGFQVGLTLPPTSPLDYPPYEEWKAFAVQQKLAVRFELGLGHSLGELVKSSALMLTTSIREGFGFSFLEPWTAGKAVTGRRLEAVAQDFEAMGVDLSSLYGGIAIPLDMIDSGRLRGLWLRVVRIHCRQYGMRFPFDAEKAWEVMSAPGYIDFAYLDAAAARILISSCASREDLRAALIRRNPFLGALLEPSGNADLIARNRRAIAENYSREKYRAALLDIYKKVMTGPVTQRINKKKLLGSFLKPENFLLGGM
jgi:glycosyltransferase involved in cell wall biosynthesis